MLNLLAMAAPPEGGGTGSMLIQFMIAACF